MTNLEIAEMYGKVVAREMQNKFHPLEVYYGSMFDLDIVYSEATLAFHYASLVIKERTT